jgi:hypothetical protein
MKLRWMQRYYGLSMPTPLCNNEPCTKHSIGMWETEDHRALDLCEACRVALGAPPMIEGIEYAPTMTVALGYRWSKAEGRAVRDENPKQAPAR